MSSASLLDGCLVLSPASCSLSNMIYQHSVYSSVLDKFSTSQGTYSYILRSCFLATPKTQAKDMIAKKRIWFTIAYISSTIITIILAATLPYNLRYLILLSLVIEIVSYFFYTLSFIPFGQKILSKIFKAMTDTE